MKTLTFFNHAGGAGKTSLTRDVGYELARAGNRVLLVDLDPQANLTSWLGVEDAPLEATVYGVAVEDAPLPQPLALHGMHLIPSHVDLAVAEAHIMAQLGAVLFLKNALSRVEDQYDVVLIDSPPSLGQLTILGALAADHLIVPVPTRQKGVNALQGLQKAMTVHRRIRPDLNVALYIPTFYSDRRNHDREFLQVLKDNLRPLASPIPQREAVWLDSATAGEPVGVYAPGSPVHQDVIRATGEVAQAAGLTYQVPA
ncbi:ParA family protein [Deinococcus hopiensis]|uniref:Chromosome partitioning protein n=1 Tax=Deinococcus hopiensis KR-140 TaxID=695939 RepID=A0A1W1VWR2_9DEIO|nr:ParA family protein [Deinococcus hopiensis]SMB97768.1 chromosome partitioning protein [Deinococcus hopiensis KR-140]